MPRPPTARVASFALPAVGVSAAYGYHRLARLPASNLATDVAALVALLGALFLLSLLGLGLARRAAESYPRAALASILLLGGLFRLLLLPAGLPREASLTQDLAGNGPAYERFLLYDNDVWRYLWEGHVTASGGNPYAHTPAELARAADAGDAQATALFEHDGWWEVYENVSYRRQPTVYPPAAQLLFALSARLAPASAGTWKLLVTAADLATCLAIAGLLGAVGRRPEWVILYAWNPMAIKELAGSGHVDAFAVALTAVSAWLLVSGRGKSALGLLAGAGMVKVAPLFLFPLWLRWTRWRGAWVPALVALAVALPFAGHLDRLVAGLGAFGRSWIFNPGPWRLAERGLAALGAPSAGFVASLLGLAVCLGVVVLASRVPPGSPEKLVAGAFLVLAAAAWLGPAVMPWYLLWALPLAVALGMRSWPLLVVASALSYFFYVERAEGLAWLVAGHGLGLLAILLELRFDPGLRERLAAGIGRGRNPSPAAP